MTEHKWHKKVREEYVEKFNKLGFIVYSSHTNISKLELFKEEVKRQNCLSDADIVVLDSENNKIEQIIEIETAINPKKTIGIILATHFCNHCRILGNDYRLENVSLKIVFKKPVERSKKALKLEVMKKPLEDIIKTAKGCLSTFKLEEHK